MYEYYKLKMSIKVKDIDKKDCSYYFFDDIINIENFDRNKIKIDEIHTKIFLFTKYGKINNVNLLYLIFSMNGYFEEINKSKFLTLVPTNKSKEIIKKYEEL